MEESLFQKVSISGASFASVNRGKAAAKASQTHADCVHRLDWRQLTGALRLGGRGGAGQFSARGRVPGKEDHAARGAAPALKTDVPTVHGCFQRGIKSRSFFCIDSDD